MNIEDVMKVVEKSSPKKIDRSDERIILMSVKKQLPELEALLEECSTWAYEGALFRFYHQSFKVHGLERTTLRIVEALRAIAPERPLNRWFREIIDHGTIVNATYDPQDTRTLIVGRGRWLTASRPILEAFFHARFFLEMAVRYGQLFDDLAPSGVPSGWATFLTLYGVG